MQLKEIYSVKVRKGEKCVISYNNMHSWKAVAHLFPGIHYTLAKERKVSNTKIGWDGGAGCQGQKIFPPRIRCIIAKNYFWERY